MFTSSVIVSPGFMSRLSGVAVIIDRAENVPESLSGGRGVMFPSVACPSPCGVTVTARLAAARTVSCALVAAPGLAVTSITDGCTESISFPVSPVGVDGMAAGLGEAACTDPPCPSRSTVAVARPLSRRRVEVFIRSMSVAWLDGLGGGLLAAPGAFVAGG